MLDPSLSFVLIRWVVTPTGRTDSQRYIEFIVTTCGIVVADAPATVAIAQVSASTILT
jgi:hypothetical protein